MSAGIAPLNAGDLNTRIEIMEPIEEDDGKAGYTTTWQVFASPWAEVLGQDGRESVIGQALQGISTYRIRILYPPFQPGSPWSIRRLRVSLPGATICIHVP